MKKVKNIIALGLVALMLAACGGGNGGSDDRQQNGERPVVTDDYDIIDEFMPSPYDFEETLMDLNGRVITLISVTESLNHRGRNYWDYDFYDIDRTSNETLRIREILREIEVDYNMEFEIFHHIATGLTQLLLNNRIAGEAPFDILESKITDFTVNALWTQGLVIPVSHPSISDIIQPQENPWRSSEFTTFGEHQWAVSFKPFNSTDVLEDVLIFNETLRQRFGLPNFYEMVRERTWTWENFDQILTTIVSESNGTVFPIIYTHEMRVTPMFVGSNNGRIVENTPTGLRFIGDINEPTLAAMHFIQTFAERGMFHPSSPRSRHLPYAHIGTAMANGEAFFAFSEYAMIRNLTRNNIGYENEYNFGIVPAPLGPNGTEFNTIIHSDMLYHILADIERPEEAAAVLVAMANRTGQITERLIEHELRHSLQTYDSAEMLGIMLNNRVIDVSRVHGLARSAGGYGIIAAGLRNIRLEVTPVVAMQHIANQMQAWYDELNAIVFIE